MIKRIIMTQLLLVTFLASLFSQDTTIYGQDIVLDFDMSSYDNVEVVGTNTITLSSGFYYSADASSSMSASIAGYTVYEPAGYSPFSTNDSVNGLDINLPVGSVPGKEGISSSGGAVYSVPFSLPVGNHGMKPDVGISYESNTNHTVLGYGWTLSGISSIMARGKSFYYDGMKSRISSTADTANRIYWDGQRLFGTNGPGLNATNFKTEIASDIIIQKLNSGSGPYFKIKTAEGITMTYGSNSDSKMKLDSNTEWKWLLDTVYNRSGDYMVYGYTTDSQTKEILLSSIEYGGSAPNFINEISFHYSTRSDIDYYYINNDLVVNTKKLDSISIESDAAFYGAYSIKYKTIDGSTLLSEITQYDKDNNRYNSTTVDWDLPVFNINKTPIDSTFTQVSNEYQHFDGDFTGDGIPDHIVLVEDYANGSFWNYLFKGTPDGLSSSAIIRELPRSYTAEMWDNIVDYMDGCSPYTPATNYTKNDITSVISGDFDGDGIQELLVQCKEWVCLSASLPSNLNTDFEGSFISPSGFDLCGDEEEYASLTEDMSDIFLSTPLARIVSFDLQGEVGTKKTWRISAELNSTKQYEAFPDFAGLGCSSFIANDTIFYYDPDNDNIFPYTAIDAGNNRWGDFNGDGFDDYILEYGDEFKIYLFDPSTKTFSLEETIEGYFLGNFDLNGDGTSAYVYQKEVPENVTYRQLWNLYCTTCDVMDNNEWPDFLIAELLTSEWGDFLENSCNFQDDSQCRSDFLDSGFKTLSSSELIVEHLNNSVPGITLDDFPIRNEIYEDVKAADISSDGKNELILFSSTALINIYYNFAPQFSSGQISYTFSKKVVNSPDLKNASFGDYNSDGHVELISIEGEKVNQYVESGLYGKKIKSITNGIGNTVSFNYATLTEGVNYSVGSGNDYPVIHYRHNRMVVDSIVLSNGVADDNVTTFSYEGFRVHLQGKGSMGYKKITSWNNLSNTYITTERAINSQFCYPYQVYVQTKIGSTEISTKENSMRFVQDSDLIFRPLLDSSRIEDKLNNVSTVQTNYYDNDYKLIKQVTEVGNLYTKTQRFQYTNAAWHSDYLISSVFTKHQRNTSTEEDSTSFLYQSGTGLLTEQRLFCNTSNEVVKKIPGFSSSYNPTAMLTIGRSGIYSALDTITQFMSYSSCGRFISATEGPLRTKVYYNYDTETGHLESQSLPNGFETTYQYGPFGQLKKRTGPDQMESVSNLYWADSNTDAPAGAVYCNWQASSGSAPVITFFDQRGRTLRTVSVDFSGEKIYTDTRYNAKGQVDSVSAPYKSGNTPLWTTFAYDNLNRLDTKTSPDGQTTGKTYNALWEKTTITKSGNSQSVEISFNALGEIVQNTDNMNNTVNKYYFPDGKIKAIVTSAHPNDTIRFTYDQKGNRISIDDPDAGEITSMYDDFGRLVREINARGDTTIMCYDDLGRITKSTDSRGDLNYVYNSDSSSVAFGKVDSIYFSNINQSEVYTYESEYGRLQSSTIRIEGNVFTNAYDYDLYGRLLTREFPTGYTVDYFYNSNGYLDLITADGLTLWNCNSINAYGQITSYSQGDYNTTVEFDQFGKIEEITTGTLLNMKYGFDNAGNLSWREDVLTEQKEVFDYDNMNRLTEIKYYDNGSLVSGAKMEIGYGDDGNIISKTDVGQDIYYGDGSAGPHALTEIEVCAYDFKSPPQDISYTSFNKVSSISDTIHQDTTLTLSFTYGISNQRVKSILRRNSAIEKIKYFYGDYEEDSLSNGDMRKYHYIHAPNGLTAIYVETDTSSSLYHVLTDRLGSIAGVVNASTDSVTKYSYNAWGVPRHYDDWTEGFTGALFADRGYTGHEHLQAFNLINMNGRVYDPVLARFLSPDPIVQFPGLADGYNRYSYVMNNPLLFTDPSGYRPAALFEEEEMMQQSGGGNRWADPFGWINSGMQQGWTQRSSPYGGWEYNWTTGKYERYTGETMSATDFYYNTPYLTSSRYVRQPTEDETKNAYSSLTGTSVEYLPGSDPLGSKMAIFTHANGTVSGGPVSFWKINGSYYNHLYYFSGLAAYSPNEAFRFAQKYRNGGTPFTRGGSVSLTAMFAAGGGWQFELGVVWDHHGGRKAYFNTGPTIGYDYSAGIQIKEIKGFGRFDAEDYQGYNSSLDGGLGPIDVIIKAGDNIYDKYQSPFPRNYEEYGWGISVGSLAGFSWQMGITTIL